ncbi:MAG: hypothetical protein ABSB35_30080 [Bryobacteraceae bacterium]
MRYRFQPWQLALLVILMCAAVLILTERHYASRTINEADLVQYLPPDQAVHVYIDVNALRGGGLLDLLAGSKAAEEPDYRRFVEQTGFDYRTDLEAVAAAFVHDDTYLVVRGHFEWKRLNDYARAQGGSCRNVACTMPANTPGRHISFYPIQSGILALAVSKEERGIDMIGPRQWKKPPTLPAEPVWVSVPSYMFTDVSNLPAGTHAFMTPLAQAQGVTFAVGPQGQGFQVRVDVECASPESGAALAAQLTSTTDLLRKMIEREHMTANPRDFSGVLTAGKFQQEGSRVVGTWPIERGFFEDLAKAQ